VVVVFLRDISAGFIYLLQPVQNAVRAVSCLEYFSMEKDMLLSAAIFLPRGLVNEDSK
jgi:hypothetical protein